MASLTQHYEIYACLPFVALHKSIKLGSIVFWPASRYHEFIAPEHQALFHSYIDSVGQIKAKIAEKQSYINTIKVDPDATCISIDASVPEEKRKEMLTDSLYLLYFASTYHQLYFSNEIPSFNSFRKLIPADLPFIQTAENWQDLFISENCREETITLQIAPPEVYEGLGQLLNIKGQEALERVLRAICYLVDRFYPRFVNIVKKGLNFNDKLYEPEDIIILAASFDAMLDIDEDQRSSDFKHKVRPLLNLGYAKPLELFWLWVDDFFEVRKKILKGGIIPDTQFKLNPNLEVPLLLIGLKMFIYTAFYTLYIHKLISKTPDELGISVDEVLIFFWTEESLIKKIERYLSQAPSAELDAEIRSLSRLYVMLEEKFAGSKAEGPHYIPTPLNEIAVEGKKILSRSSRGLPEEFISKLKLKIGINK